MVGIGLIGTGTIADFHAEAIRGLNGAELRGVYDTNPERGKEFAGRWKAESFNDLQQFLNHPDITLIGICTPSGTHRDVAIAAAEAGKHLLVEKPLEVTVEGCRDIASACERNGVVLGSVFQTRFHPAARALKEAIDGGWFGRISLVTAEVKWYRSQEYYDGSAWRGTWALDGGGALMNQSIHVVDLLLWFFGKPTGVDARAGLLTHSGIEVEDSLVAALEFQGGPLGTISVTTGAWPGSFKAIEVCGELGHVRLEEDRLVRWDFAPDSPGSKNVPPDGKEASSVVDPIRIGSEAHREQYLDMLRAIESGGGPKIGAREAIDAVELVERIYRAAGIGPKAIHKTGE